jgi:hypothetical protein
MLDGRASLDSSTTKGNDAEWFAVNLAVSRSYGGDVQLPISTVQSTVPRHGMTSGPYAEGEMWIQRHFA